MVCRKSCLLSVFVKFYWNTATFIPLCISDGWFPATVAELIIVTQAIWSVKPKIFSICSFMERKFTDS